MSDAVEYPLPGGPEEPEADAWAAACEEDLAAERARRRAESGQGPVDAAEEFRRFADALSEKVAELGRPFGAAAAAGAAQGVAQQLIGQARSVIEPVVEKNPQVFGHLAAAGGELLAAFRAATETAQTGETPQAEQTAQTDQTAEQAEKAEEPQDRDDPRGPGDERP